MTQFPGGIDRVTIDVARLFSTHGKRRGASQNGRSLFLYVIALWCRTMRRVDETGKDDA